MKLPFEVLKNRPQLTIQLTRDSVAAGDDVDAPHERSVTTYSFTDPDAFIRNLASGYLPAVAGSGHRWECLLNGVCVGSLIGDGVERSVDQIEYSQTNRVHFRYRAAAY